MGETLMRGELSFESFENLHAIELVNNKQIKYGDNLIVLQALSELEEELKNALKALIEGA